MVLIKYKGHMKSEVKKTVQSIAFPIISYENNRVSDDIERSLYSLISNKTTISYWVNDMKIFIVKAAPKIS